jgi:hypothetical protein
VGTILAKNRINIANYSLGRAEQGPEPREAMSVVRIDGTVSESVIHELRRIEAVTEAKSIRLPAASPEKMAAAQ